MSIEVLKLTKKLECLWRNCIIKEIVKHIKEKYDL